MVGESATEVKDGAEAERKGSEMSLKPKALIPLTGRRQRTDGLTDGLASKHMPSYQQKQRIKILKNMSQLLLIQFFYSGACTFEAKYLSLH